MRFLGLAYVGVLVTALAAFRMHAGTEAPPAVAPPESFASVLVAEPMPMTATEPIWIDEPVRPEPGEAA